MILDNRVKELDEAGVLRSGEAAEKQKLFIGKLSDDEFSEYKEHLIDTIAALKSTIVTDKPDASAKDKIVSPESGKTGSDVTNNDPTNSEPKDKASADDTVARDADKDTSGLISIDPRQLAALSATVKLSDETRSKYAALFEEE
jgi:hypothetical protein